MELYNKEELQRVVIGIQYFETIRENNYFYIDKTNFIKEWWDNGDSVTLITRPRRFGRTLTLSMLEAFFSIDYANRSDLFEGLQIWEEEKYRKLQGMYPVISLHYGSIKCNSYKDAGRMICEKLRQLYSKFYFIRNSNVLDNSDKNYFDKIATGVFSATDACKSLHNLSKFIYQYYNSKVIILVDEYDIPMREAYMHGYWEELVTFLRKLFNSTFKTNSYLERGLMMGITSVSRESVFSDLNHLEIVTVTSKKYTASFGFTEDEVLSSLRKYGLIHEKEKVKFWYGGFIFGDVKNIYNPWSITNFLNKRKFGFYGIYTCNIELEYKLIKEGDRELKKSFESLLCDEEIKCKINECIAYNELGDDEESVWRLLVPKGYLRIRSCGQDASDTYLISIPNHETKYMFKDMVRKWFNKTEGNYNDFVKALLRCDVEEMNAYMSRVALRIYSDFDTGKGLEGNEPERFYHVVVLGLHLELEDRYVIISNRESGQGRYDVMIVPKDKKDSAFILEFKVYEKDEEKDLEETVQSALKQMGDKRYDEDLVMRGIPKDNIHKYGFAFEGKNVLIGGQ